MGLKRTHKITFGGLRQEPEEISDRYQAEIDSALRRAEKAWRQVDRQRQRAEEKHRQKPTPSHRQAWKLVCAEAERLWAEFEELDRLMKGAPVSSSNSGAGQSRHRTGRDDHLEQGMCRKSRKRKPR